MSASVTLAVAHTWEGAPAAPSEHASVTLRLDAAGLHVAVHAPRYGDPPPPGPPGSTWKLWEHEVVELFVLGADGRSYTELELGPHGHFLLLQLEGRRNAVATELPVEARWEPGGGPRWRAQARLPLAVLPAGPWRGNAYAIHGAGAARRYLAWAPVPGPEPDFHRLEHFRPLGVGTNEDLRAARAPPRAPAARSGPPR